jgi:NTP pyrophosphatase (non-canonical NTP hydrolase)
LTSPLPAQTSRPWYCAVPKTGCLAAPSQIPAESGDPGTGETPAVRLFSMCTNRIPSTLRGNKPLSSIAELTERVRAFAQERNWEQFHTPKNLAMALAGEVGELLAELQWLTPEQSAAVMQDEELGPRVRAEIGDVTIYLVRLADVLGIDLVQAALEKTRRLRPPIHSRSSTQLGNEDRRRSPGRVVAAR